VFKQHVMKAAWAVSVLSMALSAGVAAAQNAPAGARADEALDGLAKAMKVAGQPDKKRALLADVAKLSSLRALSAAVAAAADKDVAQEALAAAGQIAKTLMVPEQPPYIRRSAFLRWVGCQSEPQKTKTVMDALRGKDVVLHSCALGILTEGGNRAVLASLAKDIASFPPEAQSSLIDVFAIPGDAAAESALIGLTRQKDKKLAAKAVVALSAVGGEKALAAVREALADADASVREAAVRSLGRWADASPLPALLGVVRKPRNEGEKAIALRGIARLARKGKPDKAAQATLLEALNLVAGSEAGEETVVAAIPIALALIASHPDEVKQALDKLMAGKLTDAARQRIRAALLTSSIDQLPNLARGAKASSADKIPLDGPRPEAHAIDGNPATYWDKTDGHPLYRLLVEFPKPTEVSALSIVGWAHESFSPKDFEVVCDGKTVQTVKNAAYVDNRLIVAFPRTTCKSLELKITGHYGGSPAVRELGIFNAP